MSRDGGKTFEEIGKGHGPAYIFDKDTAVVAEAKTKDKPKPGLLRTTDGGKTFQPSGDYAATALPKSRDGASTGRRTAASSAPRTPAKRGRKSAT